LTKKTQQRGQWHIKAGAKAINNDNDLKEAVVEAEKRGDRFLNVDIVGGSAPPAARPVTQAAQPVRAATPAASQPYTASVQPAHTPQPQPSPAPVQQTVGVVTSIVVPADPNGQDKPRINATQDSRAYVFSPVSAKNATTVEVIVANSKQLQFKMTQDTNTGRIQMTQSFNMPFDISAQDLSIAGNTFVLTFPF